MTSTKPIFLITAFLLLTACAPLSLEESYDLGEEMYEQISTSITLIEDERTIAYIRKIVSPLLESPPDSGHEFQFHIIDSPGFNAFATGGGHIYLTKGVILSSRNIAELVSILGHEIAHIKLGHIENSYRSNKTTRTVTDITGITLAIVTGNPLAMGAGDATAQLAGTALISSYSRESEREADELAFNIMVSNHYDPRSQLIVFSRLQIAESEIAGDLPFLMTHPLTSERISLARTRLESIGNFRNFSINDGGELQEIQEHLIAISR